MKKRILAALLLLCLCLTGCAQEEDTKVLGSEIWTEGLPLTWGQLEGEKLAVLPWDSGRTEATSHFAMAETRDGYYMGDNTRLIYADKVNLSLWVPVCNQPNCSHTSMYQWSYGEIWCNAEIGPWGYYIKDDRIWTALNIFGTELAVDEEEFALVSMNPDGTGKRVETTDQELLETLTTLSVMTLKLLPWEWIYSIEEMQQDGSLVVHCYRHDGSGWDEYFQAANETGDRGWSIGLNLPRFMRGDTAIQNDTVSTREGDYIRFLEEGYEIINLPSDTGYLSGDIFRYYKQNDGYYDFNIRTREEVKLADARTKNGHAHIFLPNCIVESSLLSPLSLNTRDPGMSHTLEIFDGQQWHTVALPPELQNSENTFLLLQAVTSDSILFTCQKKSSGESTILDLYRIDLTSDIWDLEYVTQIRSIF